MSKKHNQFNSQNPIFSMLALASLATLGYLADPFWRIRDAVAEPRNQKLKTVTRDSEALAEKKDLLLVAGLQTVLDLTFKPCEPIAECIKVVNPALVTVQWAKEKKQLIFSPVKNGETTISVRDESGDMKLILKTLVTNSNLARAAREIKDLLKDIEGLEFRILGNKIVVDGEIIVPNDLQRVFAVLSDGAYKDLVMNLVTVSPIGQRIIAKRIQDEINNPKITVRVLGGKFMLEGTVENRLDATRAEQILKNLIPPKVEFNNALEGVTFKLPNNKEAYINLIRIVEKKEAPKQKIVRLTLSFVELSKDYARDFGFQWQPGLDTGGQIAFGQSSTGGITSSAAGTIAGTISNLFPKLRSAQNAGYARVLQEVTLLTQSGVQGKVSKTQKIPVSVVDTKTGLQSFQAAEVGLDALITPNVGGQDDGVNMKVNFKFSSLAGTVNNAPVVAQNSYQGSLIVKSSESAAVMNLITNDILTDFNKSAPGQNAVAANPLFSLVRSKSFSKKKSQFVIFITPQLVESAAVGTEDIKRKYGIRRR